MLEPGFERVYTMTDYYDGPRQGMADFRGEPHHYLSEWNETKQDFGNYQLTAINIDVLELALEEWAIWKRWETAFHSKLTNLAMHPTLPEERERFEEIQPILRELMSRHRNASSTAIGTFKIIDNPSVEESSFTGLQVVWRVIE